MPEILYGGIPLPPGPPPDPEPAHARRILREKRTEIITVIVLILAGAGFLAFREYLTRSQPDAAASVVNSRNALAALGYHVEGDPAILFGKHFTTLENKIEGFDSHADLVGMAPDAPLETLILWLTPAAGPALSDAAMLAAVNNVGEAAQAVVRSSSDALEKASNTMDHVGDVPRPHEKGVQQTADGWKLTYVTYRTYDEKAEPQPMLCLILQRMSVASDDSLSEMNRTIYEAVREGRDIKTTLREVESHSKQTPGTDAVKH